MQKDASSLRAFGSESGVGLVFRHFSKKGQDHQDLAWEQRRSVVRTLDGFLDEVDVEVPGSWSQNATDTLAQKYLRRRGVPSLTVSEDSSDPLSPSSSAPGAEVGSETSLKHVVHRMAGCWAYWGRKSGLLTEEEALCLYDEAYWLLVRQVFAPNSPQWFNTGLSWAYGIGEPASGHWYVDSDDQVKEISVSYERPQPHACFIQSVSDDLVSDGGIMDLFLREARLFKYGSGTGSNFSDLRGKNEPLSGGGRSSGLMSWLKIGDRSAGAIKSGGTTRRAAKMVILDVDHPDIEEFVSWKVKEEEKVAALVAGSKINRRAVRSIFDAVDGYQSSNCVDYDDRYDPTKNAALRDALRKGKRDGVPEKVLLRALSGAKTSRDLPSLYDLDWQGVAYETVSGQQSNNSISISDRFMEAVASKDDWDLIGRTTNRPLRTVSAEGLFHQICDAAWTCADPGLQFIDTMNDWHTCPESGPIRGSNPCAEYLFIDDTACNLASVRLTAFLRLDGSLDLDGFESVVRLVTTILEISVSMASLPSKEIARKTFDFRTLGLGFADLGALLMQMGIPYDSEEGRRVAASLTAFMTAVAYDQSGRMASRVGPFKAFSLNEKSFRRVLDNHSACAHGRTPDVRRQPPRLVPEVDDRAFEIQRAAMLMWDQALGHESYRNAQVTCIAPTGTIGIVMDCDTTGIEPDFSLVKLKSLAGGGSMKIINQSVPEGLRRLGYSDDVRRSIQKWVSGSAELSYGVRDRLKTILPLEALDRIERALPMAISFESVLTPFVIGEDLLEEAGLDPSSSIPFQMGFSAEELRQISLEVCGHQNLETCPLLRREHLAVFDCANRCGEGVRSIDPMGHLLMLAAVQPFLSGSSSKTVNLPSSATVEDVRKVFEVAWTSGVKCVALYVDGSKFSQPLSSLAASQYFGIDDLEETPQTVIVEKVVEKIVERVVSERRVLPYKRRGYTQKAVVGGHKVFLRTGEHKNGDLGEIFIDIHKEGTAMRAMIGAFATAVSMGLQYGVPLEKFVDQFTFTQFDPAGPVMGDDRIYMCSSLLDWIFRHLAITYLGREDLAQISASEVEVDEESSVDENVLEVTPSTEVYSGLIHSAPLLQPVHAPMLGAGMTFSGELCSQCGSYSMIRQGRCSRCANPSCGAESGGCG